MPAIDWSQCPALESVPDLGGVWVFRGTRMPVSAIFENLEVGATMDEIIEQFDVTREQINTVLEFAARSLDAPLGRREGETRTGADLIAALQSSPHREIEIEPNPVRPPNPYHTAALILEYADEQLSAVPQNERETTLQQVIDELTAWREATR